MYAVRARHCFDGTRFVPGGATVLVEGHRVVGVEPAGHEVPSDVQVTRVDGTLLPGLVETHVHLVTDSGPAALDRVAGRTSEQLDDVVTEALGRHLRAGVTTVRDLGDRDYLVVGRRDRQRAAADGARPVEPRIVAAGPPVTSPGGHCHFMGGAAGGVDQVRAAVRERVARGVDVVKVMASGGMNTPGTDVTRPQFPLEVLRVLVEEAHAAGLPVAAHAHAAEAVEQALGLGVDSIEHASYLRPGGHVPGAPPITALMSAGAGDVDLARLAAGGVAVCPTLGGFSPAAMAQAPPELLARIRGLGTSPELLFEARTVMVRRMAEAGVRLVSGADAGIMPGKAHGAYAVCIADLAAAVPLTDALVSATSRAAEVCGVGDRAGRVEAGYDADLLVVEGDLAQDVTALGRVEAVVLQGSRVV